MGLFISVVKELSEFVWESVRGVIGVTAEATSTDEKHQIVSPPAPTPSPAQVIPLGLGESAYSVASSAKVFSHPFWAFDTVVGELPYGTSVQIYAYQGRFARVEHPLCAGWIHMDDLTTDGTTVFPDFVVGQVYEAVHPEVLKLRCLMQDRFFAGELFLPLQPGELVSYRLQEAGFTVPWPPIRPRTPGRWHEILRGVRGVKIGLSPHTGSIIEGRMETDDPVLGYIRSVDPSEEIEIETVVVEKEGLYERRVMSRTEWMMWRPVFIQIM